MSYVLYYVMTDGTWNVVTRIVVRDMTMDIMYRPAAVSYHLWDVLLHMSHVHDQFALIIIYETRAHKMGLKSLGSIPLI